MAEVRTYEQVKRILNGDELRGLGEQLAHATQHLISVRDAKSAAVAGFNAELKAAGELIGELSERISLGYELVEVETMTVLDSPRPGLKRVIRIDTSEVLREEPMTLAERQTSFGFNLEPEGGEK